MKIGEDKCIVDEICDVAYSGKEAMALIHKGHQSNIHYQLVFMDCSMPVLDGYATTTRIRKFYQLKNKS